MSEDFNLEELLAGITPSVVTPHLGEILSANSKSRPKLIAHLIIRGMANGQKHLTKKEILHDGEIHAVHYVNVEPLCTGSWALISLLLLNLSYGEQSTIIEALYPKNLQLSAKGFAAQFTPELKSGVVVARTDEELRDGIESANAGIAMILSLLKNVGTIPHADEIDKNRERMKKLVEAGKDRAGYRNASERAEQAAKHQDGLLK